VTADAKLINKMSIFSSLMYNPLHVSIIIENEQVVTIK
jgi:hypothetical protein